VRPAHHSAAEYYRVPADNFRTYPLYHPDFEPPGFWENLHQQKPEPLVDASAIRTTQDWIGAGQRAFAELDSFWARTDDPALIAEARNPKNFAAVMTRADGSVGDFRWVVTPAGVMLSRRDCARCHRDLVVDQGADSNSLMMRPEPAGMGDPATLVRTLPRYFLGDTVPVAVWRQYTVPWAPDERIEQLRTLDAGKLTAQDQRRLTQLGARAGNFPRPHGSPYHNAKIPDLRTLRYNRYIDATATHRLRGPEDVARYAAFIMGADPMEFGSHRILSDAQRPIRYRYADEVLYAIGMYLMSLEPKMNPQPAAAAIVAQGEAIFRREGCASCHVPPNYTSGKLTLARGWSAPANHPYRDDIVPVSVGTDEGLALRTRKGTGFYKIPSLRGVWYRPFLLHDGSVTSLEEMFDPARHDNGYEPKGWNPPQVSKRAVPGHRFGLSLSHDDKAALLAFLRSL
jgi:mono/diheme cytochrome c family protein